MSLLDTFRDSGVKIEENPITSPDERDSELKSRAEYLTMSEATEQDLRKRAVKLGLVPIHYKNAEFDVDKIKANITKQQNQSGHKFNVSRFKDYFETTSGIINAIRFKQLPKKSYIIGAPNGFGKQSFATDCILASLYNGWLTVPYVSLIELAELKAENDKVLMRGLMGVETEVETKAFDYGVIDCDDDDGVEYTYRFVADESEIKTPKVITGRYSWSEYINAPILICFFSGVESKVVESQILYTLLNIRSAKGFPTIAMISTALTMYENDPVIGKYIWKEIKSYDKNENTYSRVFHVSCYKKYDSFDYKAGR